MMCPRCQNSDLDERTRDGVVVDACPRCRGVWLDRGELEKLIARAASDIEQYREHDRARDVRYDREPPSSDRGHAAHRGQDRHYRKKGLLESLGDIFD